MICLNLIISKSLFTFFSYSDFRVTSENPQLRYTVGNDAATIKQARVSMSDNQFKEMIMQNFLLDLLLSHNNK